MTVARRSVGSNPTPAAWCRRPFLRGRSSVEPSPCEETDQREHDDRERGYRIKADEHGKQDAQGNANDPVSVVGHSLDFRDLETADRAQGGPWVRVYYALTRNATRGAGSPA